jgi:hypothetical protein
MGRPYVRADRIRSKTILMNADFWVILFLETKALSITGEDSKIHQHSRKPS